MSTVLYIEVTEEFKQDFHRLFLRYGTWEKFGESVGSDMSWLRKLPQQKYVKEELVDKIFAKSGRPDLVAIYDAQPLSVIQQRIEAKINA